MSSSIVTTLSAAVTASGEYRAGGTDVMDRLRHHLLTKDIVDISRIPALDGIAAAADGTLSIGALATIHAVATDAYVKQFYPGLSMTAGALANPQIRRAASMGGALLQRNRCWYYRHEDFSCVKKGGSGCPMRAGNHQYGVCYDLGTCVSPHPSTLGMALMAYDAEIEVHGKGRRKMDALYGDGKSQTSDHLLGANEVLVQIHLPKPIAAEVAHYMRAIARARAEWPLVEVLAVGRKEGDLLADVRLVMGGVANVPLRLTSIEAFLKGKPASSSLFEEAGKMAISTANPLRDTAYKLPLVAQSISDALTGAFLKPGGGK